MDLDQENQIENFENYTQTPKLIIHGLKQSMVCDLMNYLEGQKVQNFDIARIKDEGIATLTFEDQVEAKQVQNLLQNEKGYQVELTMDQQDENLKGKLQQYLQKILSSNLIDHRVVKELHEIPETDENNNGQDLIVQQAKGYNSDYSLYNCYNVDRNSPITPQGYY